MNKWTIFWEKMKDNLKTKTKYVFNPIPYLIFFVTKEPFKKHDLQQKQNLEDMGLLIVENHLLL
jgi:hypothetical protein